MKSEREIDIHFPKLGVNVSAPANRWPLKLGRNQEKLYYCADALNCRSYDALSRRNRGGSRPGLVKHIDDRALDFIAQHLNVIMGTGFSPPGGGMQSAQSGRVVTVVLVAEGTVEVYNPGDTTLTTPTNNAANTPALNASGIMFSSNLLQKMYFADGLTDHCYYDPATNTVEDWTASAGTFPEFSGNGPRLICTWRGRICLSGIIGDGQNIFMTKVNDATDFDYIPVNPSAIDAVNLSLSDMGQIGDIVNGMIPATDDVLVVLGDHTIYKITGDPLAGGQIDLVSDSIGGAWGQAWCKGPDGSIYFFSNIPGIYAMPPMAQGFPQRISHDIDPLLEDVDTGNSTISMVWSDRYSGFHVYITPNDRDDGAEALQFFYEVQRPDGSGGGWWPDAFADTDMNPLVCCVVDGNEANDRTVCIGSWDGYIRAEDPDATTDDGEEIASHILLGPILSPIMDEMRLKTMQGEFADGSADVQYGILLGDTAEQALTATAVTPDSFSELRGYTKLVNRSAHALYVRLASTGQWAMEKIRMALAAHQSAVRRRRNG